MTRTYKFIGVSTLALDQFGAKGAKIVKSDSAITIDVEFDGKDVESIDEYMASLGWVPA